MSDISNLAKNLGLTAEDIEKAAKRLVKQREYRKNHPSKSAGGKKWAELSAEEKAKRMEYQKNYTSKRNANLSRLSSLAEEMNMTVEELLDTVEKEFLGGDEEGAE